jgi:ElaB/YqjD/DUF883 family membrane-anchored ribosome-binding protein
METSKAVDQVTQAVKDAGYVIVGLGVIAFQRAQVRRRELAEALKANSKTIESQVTEARSQIAKVAKTVEERLDPVVSLVEERLDEVEERLPETARTWVQQARQQARQTNEQIRSWILGAAA